MQLLSTLDRFHISGSGALIFQQKGHREREDINMSEFQPVVPQKTNGFAIAGFVTALVCCSPLGIIFSSIGLSQISKNPSQKDKGLAVAGLIIGIFSFIISIFFYEPFFNWIVDGNFYSY